MSLGVENESPIRGVTSVDKVAILNVEGTGTSAVNWRESAQP